MEPSHEGERTLAQTLVHWRSVGLVGACLAGGLTLTVMVIGSAPTINSAAAAALDVVSAEEVAAEASVTVAGEPATTEMTPDSTEVPVGPVVDVLAVPVGSEAVVVSGDPSAPLAGSAQPLPSGGVAAARPTLAPSSPPAPPLPAPAATAAPAPVAPTIAAPTTAAPTTAAPTPAAPTPAPVATTAPTAPAPVTTAAPTTAAPQAVALSYPGYTVSGVSVVSLQFDGSSISVASVSPEANWVYEIETNGSRTVEIKFFNVATGRDREFHATVEGGRIKVET